MQTLTAGSFLNLGNAETFEALKHTARRLAEHTATVVKENLPPAALENLANSLWQKAEYVTREPERRRLHQIFVENFSERFRELKREVTETQNSDSVISGAGSTVETNKLVEQPPAPIVIESGEIKSSASVENVASPISPEAFVTEAHGKKDEFLGFVGPGEPFGDEGATEAVTATTTEPKETPPATAQAGDERAGAETSQPEAHADLNETPDLANQVADAENSKEPETAKNSNHAKPETTVAAAATSANAENKPTTAAATTAATANATKNGTVAQEPFEFEKCTINLNLTLLPAESGSNRRKAIVGAVSHNLPPEIDFLDVADGGDSTEIAALIGEKLARFKQTLPVKYIEQLRASKNKSAKKGAGAAKTTAAAAQHSASNQAHREKTSGGQKTQEASDVKTVTPQAGTIGEKGNNEASTVPNQAVNQSVTANSIQGSLF